MKAILSSLILSVFLMSSAQSKDSDLMKDLTFKTSTGVSLKYLLFTPKDYNASQKYPLVVVLHSSGSDYLSQVNNNDNAHPWIEDSVQSRVPNFIMAPNCPSGSWGGMMGAGTALSAECKAVIEAVEDLKKQFSLDTTRFIISGFSLGGAGTYHMIKFLPNYWAAACPAGAGGDSLQFNDASKPATPIWHHQGSNDGSGGPLIRMANALVKNKYPVLRVTCDMVLNANSGNGPAQWTREIQKGTKPQDIIFKNAVPSYDSVSKAVDAGAKYIFQMITTGNHEDSRINANHNPLLAKWAFMQSKGKTAITTISLAPKSAEAWANRNGTFLTLGHTSNLATGRIFTLLGQTSRVQGTTRNFGAQTMWVRSAPEGKSSQQKTVAR